MNRFLLKLSQRKSDLILALRPRLAQMPAPIQPFDDPFLPFGKAIITVTRDLLAGYMFDLAAYMALGAAGMVALERTIAYVDEGLITILHGPFASSDYAAAAGSRAFNVDAVTLTETSYAQVYLDENLTVFAPDGAGEIGTYSETHSQLVFGDVVLRILGEDVLYADGTDNFTNAIRDAVKAQSR